MAGAVPCSMDLYPLLSRGANPSTAAALTPRAAAHRSGSAHSFPLSTGQDHTLYPVRASSTRQMTAKEPTWGSFNISMRRALSRRDNTASLQSMNPSKWMNPVRHQGAAVMHRAKMGPGAEIRTSKKPIPAQISPSIPPKKGRHRSIWR